MQLHEVAQAAPVLARQGLKNSQFCMQIHAPYACMADLMKRKGNFLVFLAAFFASLHATFERVNVV